MGDVGLLYSARLDELSGPQQPTILAVSSDNELEPTVSPDSTSNSVTTGIDGGTQDEIAELWKNVDSDEMQHGKTNSVKEIHEDPEQIAKLVASPLQQPEFLPTSAQNEFEAQVSPERPESTVSPLPSVIMTSPPASPTASTSTSFVATPPEASSSRTNLRAPTPTMSSQSSPSSLDRRQSRRRSTLGDFRANNRFSNLLSTFMHRRPDRENQSSAPDRKPSRDFKESASAKGEPSSRTSSPSRPPRPVTPPPTLPPPTLQELGLSLTAITPALSPSHFSSPPINGTFLKPHFLLLCHNQGLDVVPLLSPPAPQPYALIRRVSFRSVVVMEEKGVVVAIAGRRDGVRVYALDDVKKAVEWRIDVEIRREREKMRREEMKRGVVGGVDKVFGDLHSKSSKDERLLRPKTADSPSTPTPPTPKVKRKKSSLATVPNSITDPPKPRAPTTGRRPSSKKKVGKESQTVIPNSDPPSYEPAAPSRPTIDTQASVISVAQTRSRSGSMQNVFTGAAARRISASANLRDPEKGDWEHDSSDDEAINLASAGPSGSAALDERTSAISPHAPSDSGGGGGIAQQSTTLDMPNLAESRMQAGSSSTLRRNRPTQLDLSLGLRSNNNDGNSRPPPSPTPSVWTLQQALSPSQLDERTNPVHADDGDDDDDEGVDQISFAQAMIESRLPELPPPGSQQPQVPIFITPRDPASPTSMRATAADARSSRTVGSHRTRNSRRRWSVFDGVFSHTGSNESILSSPRPLSPASRPSDAGSAEMTSPTSLTRISSVDDMGHRPSPSLVNSSRARPSTANSVPEPARSIRSTTPSTHRFLPRIITNALTGRRSDELPSPGAKHQQDPSKAASSAALPPPPKLEYVKLPGTKGSILIKAVETPKKSFLAILCGENGEKVELFAGTYRTTLGLSRTFILPDSPRSLELQLQGDDLVEVFLVFSHNVFGLEPATVRVREVRVGRAERRAAMRRARENRNEELQSSEVSAPSLGDSDATDAVMSVGVTLASSVVSQTFDEAVNTSPSISRQASASNLHETQVSSHNAVKSDELTAIASAHVAPYTTFQQLSFAPQFPIATIADSCTIPPTYQSFLEYRAQYEPEPDGTNNLDLANVQFSPPGLPVPPSLPPSKWVYRDPKGIIQGPWKASLMQTWYKEGLLPPDLPVRREEDEEYILLKDLRAQSVDPSHPFRSTPPPLHSFSLPAEAPKPLLEPISLLTQHRRYGPPALFFTTRGGHSTSIVDSKGRSVLRGRLHWSNDDNEDVSFFGSRLGDVKRLEAFDVGQGAVLAAVRKGGLEVTDFSDALLSPGDCSRAQLPNYKPNLSSVSRRSPFVWRVGYPLSAFASGPISSEKVTTSVVTAPLSKKQGLGKLPARSEFALGTTDDPDGKQNEELLHLGRVGENVYFCERSNGSFRILRLCPISAS